ncbi:hypothetical protein ACEWY4_026509 [Coilia grayii]|uniref:5-hydroxytryptamine receptor 3A-like n=1 Tax=Coilia grayii TaxID=363190 RepID=A0ABD1IV24_9TELE
MGADSPDCSYLSLLNHLGVGPNNHAHSVLRPVRHWKTPTNVLVDLYLSVIIEVNEKFQSLTTGVFMATSWTNELVQWDPRDFCGISMISIPKEYLWRPATSVLESIEAKLSYTDSPYLNMLPFGFVFMAETYKITSTCRMDLYKFPFDTQQCQLTVLPIMNTIDQIRLSPSSNSSDVTAGSLTVFQTQGEWDLISIHVSTDNLTVDARVWDKVVYTITISRRPQLYVINFLVPIFLFLVLDLMSFFMNEARGEKLSFKITILLAISVLLLILHDILPSTHQKTPLIGVFCTGIFMFVGCSIAETIAVSFLMRMASKCDTLAATRGTLETRTEEGGSQQTGSEGAGGADDEAAIAALLRLILREMQALQEQSSSDHARHAGTTCLYLTTVAKGINTLYFLLYICAVLVFLAEVGKQWYY